MQRILDRMADTNPETRGQIILLHDAGGDRSHTVAALPRVIDAAARQGSGDRAGIGAGRLDTRPGDAIASVGGPSAVVNWYVFITASWLQAGMHWLFVLAIALGLARLVALCGLAIVEPLGKRVPPPPLSASDGLTVSVLIPGLQRSQGHRRLGPAGSLRAATQTSR